MNSLYTSSEEKEELGVRDVLEGRPGVMPVRDGLEAMRDGGRQSSAGSEGNSPAMEPGEIMVRNLREYRRQYRLTQQEVADYLEVQRSTYARYEEGTNRPNYKILIRLADLYGVSVDTILGRNLADSQLKQLQQLLMAGQEMEQQKLYMLYAGASKFARDMALLILKNGQDTWEATEL